MDVLRGDNHMEHSDFKPLIEWIRDELLGKEIQINNFGPDLLIGKLLHVGSDFLVINVKGEGVVYTNLKHVKNISLRMAFDEQNSEEPQTSFIMADNFAQLLGILRYSFLQVNRDPEKIIGMLMEIHNDWISLSDTTQSLIVIPTVHIRSVSTSRQRNKSEGNTNKDQKNKGG
jgi:spore coat protein B